MNKLFRLKNVFTTLDGVLKGLVPNEKRDETVAPLTMHNLGEALRRYVDHVNEGFTADDFFAYERVDGKFLEAVAKLVARDSQPVQLGEKYLNPRVVLWAMHEYQHRYYEDDLLLNSNNKSYLEEFVADVAFDLCKAYPNNKVTYAIKTTIAKHQWYVDGKPIAPLIVELCELQTIIKTWLGRYASLVIGMEYL